MLNHLEKRLLQCYVELTQDQIRNEIEDISPNLLTEFGTVMLMDESKVFTGKGPKDFTEKQMVRDILGNLNADIYPAHNYLQSNEEKQARYQELKEWTRDEFAKWQAENRALPGTT